ncbi:TonB-dependent outer membrane receptor, SusC/RagA subfamily, signature region [Chryseobacterium oleae]|uniref:TonB-dependent outer membrane receptor, SusC/RagA subfamily, signature region n=1 Tax=Chryseobacterium oleae TaxID=491207 RepID=A0A1I4VL82_CHROL|nr:TonB-dependent receptor plug domain-containing protein [Chryseobacterium oleae]SFN01736.1 TonB-dependent outer membrane receptor, SusC/RagA subfamily, signature region [Chryseobacterium oleae]
MKITIPKPCHENWEAMTPEEKGRFCSVCSKTVRDFTISSDQEIIEVFSHSSENICGNFNASQLNRDLNYSFVNSLFTKFAVGFMMTTGGFVSVNAQQNTVKDTLATEEIREIVFHGFNKQKDQKLLGAVSIIQANALNNPKEGNIKEIQPKVQGLIINQMPENRQDKTPIRIGGAHATMREDQKPLVVVNKKIISFKDLQEIDPNTIKTMNVLKGASATAVYGSQAQNGVIIITTKKKGKMKK